VGYWQSDDHEPDFDEVGLGEWTYAGFFSGGGRCGTCNLFCSRGEVYERRDGERRITCGKIACRPTDDDW
jgi:hypothetical protein